MIVLSGSKTRRVVESASARLAGLPTGHYALSVRSVVVRRATGDVRSGALAYPAQRRVTFYFNSTRPRVVTVRYAGIVNPNVRAAPRVVNVIGDPQSPGAVVIATHVHIPPVGEILTSGPTGLLPVGLMAKVTRVAKKGVDTVLSVSGVPVADAIPSLAFSGSLRLTPIPGSTTFVGAKARAASGCTAPRLANVKAHLDCVELREAFIGAWPPQVKLTLALRTTESLGVAAAAAGINCDWTGPELGPYAAVLPVGPIPVPVYATLPFKAGVHINGTLQAGTLNVASTTVAHAAAGGDENTASLVEQGSNVWISGVLALAGSAKLSASIGVQAGIGIAKAGNLHVEAGFGPEFDWVSGRDCELAIDLGSLSAGTSVIGHSLNTPSFTPIKLHLWHGCHGGGGGGGGGGDGGGGGGGDGGGDGGGVGAGGGETGGTITVTPTTIVAGQELHVATDTPCPQEPITGSEYTAETELLPEGAPIDGTTDSTHATYRVGVPRSAEAWGGSEVVKGPYVSSPDLQPGHYEVAAQCVFRATPSATPETVYVFQRAAFTVDESGRAIQVEPATAAPGDTVTITPEQPCVPGSEGGIHVTLHEPDGDEKLLVGETDPSCNWGPSHFVLASDSQPGEYSLVVDVGGWNFAKGIPSDIFEYRGAVLHVS